MATFPTAPGENPPPDLPSMPDVSQTLSTYLRTFALWCRQGFASKLGNSAALPGIMLMATDAPSGSNPPVYMLEVTSGGALALAPMALGSGMVGTPVAVGEGDYLPLGGGVLSGTLSAPLGITYGNWGYGGQAIRFDYDHTNWGIAVIVNNANVVGASSFLPISFGDSTYTPVRAWALNGAAGLVYAWWSPSSAWTWANGASDIRLKSNLELAGKDALAAINALSVVECDVTYPFPDAQPQHWNWAIVADEDLGAKIPSAYIAAEEHTHALVRELPVIAALVKAVQQLSARVEELEAAR